ncbi:MAG: tetratricopeptide repeat protein [Bacteroidales bacterium]|nr:tetratricopeptide repeat protein [Bacteroidales bacterium]
MILVLATALLSAGIMSAQDLAQATELYNNGANALTTGDKKSALEYFQKAYEMGKTIGEEADELVKNCKQAIPTVMLSMAKELSNNQEYDKALEQIQAAITVAKEFAVSEVEEEATSLLPQIELMKDMDAANDAFNAKDLTGAAALYNKVLEADPSNGPASIRLVQCLANAGKIDEAKAALATAEANGQGENAKKVIGGALLKVAANNLKEKKFAEALANAVQVNEYTENAQAFLVAGQASQQLKKNAEAIKYFEQYLEAAPNAKNANAITFTVGALYQGANNKTKALENYKKVVNDPKWGVQAKQMIDALSK